MQRCVVKVLAGEEDVKKGERCSLRAACLVFVVWMVLFTFEVCNNNYRLGDKWSINWLVMSWSLL